MEMIDRTAQLNNKSEPLTVPFLCEIDHVTIDGIVTIVCHNNAWANFSGFRTLSRLKININDHTTP